MGNKVITLVEVCKRNKERVNVFINDEFCFSCSLQLVYTHGLKKGLAVDMDYLKQIIEEDEYIKCKNQALKIIEKVYKSEKEMRDKLLVKEYEENTINRVLNFLKEYNFLDDERYAFSYVKERSEKEGKNKIKYNLVKKGINEELIVKALSSIDSLKQKDTAFKLIEKKKVLLEKTEKDKLKVKKKLGDYLFRNGFDKDIIHEVLSNQNEEEETVFKELKDSNEENLNALYELIEKRYNIIKKSENNPLKIYKKLTDYALRRGYNYNDIKKSLQEILDINSEDY